jgi:hypothetical protein
MKPGAPSASAAIAACGTFDGPEPNRPSRGRSVSGIAICVTSEGGALTESR